MITDANSNPIDLDSIPLKLPRPAMTREEWNHHLEVNPATDNQVGTIMHKFHSLGFTKADRDERLDIISALVGRDILSTFELRQGEAGKLVDTLQPIHTLDDLYALLPNSNWEESEPREEKRQIPWKAIAFMAAGVVVAAL